MVGGNPRAQCRQSEFCSSRLRLFTYAKVGYVESWGRSRLPLGHKATMSASFDLPITDLFWYFVPVHADNLCVGTCSRIPATYVDAAETKWSPGPRIAPVNE